METLTDPRHPVCAPPLHVLARLAFLSTLCTLCALGSSPLHARQPDPVVLNEIDYDQPGADAAEFVEIKNVGAEPVDLGAYALQLVNGSGEAAVYATVPLPAVLLHPGGYYVVCAQGALLDACDLGGAAGGGFASLQNGAPDAVALVRLEGSATRTLVDVVSYEGDTPLPYREGSGTGLEDPGSTTDLRKGLSRLPDGEDSGRNNVDWSVRCVTPGAPNAPPVHSCEAVNLSLSVRLEGGAGLPGGTVTYTLAYANAGLNEAHDVRLTERVPAFASSDPVNAAGGWYETGNGLLALDLGTLPAGAAGEASFTILLASPLPAGLTHIVNEASLSAREPERQPDPDANTASVRSPVENPSRLVLNEIDYEQPGADDGEFIEVMNPGPHALDLSPYVVRLVNGSAGASVYDEFGLPPVALAPGAYFVVCAEAARVEGCDLGGRPGEGFTSLQNGAPDAVALVLADGSQDGVVVDVVSYEGDTGPPLP